MTGSVPVLTAPEAVAVAADLAERFAKGAAERDTDRLLPVAELDALSDSGLLAATVPAAYGGADLSVETLTEVVRLVATGDPNVAQVPHSHFVYVNALRHQGTGEQRAHLFGEVLAGRRFGNAQSELGTKHVRDFRTTLRPRTASDGTGGCSTARRDTARARCSRTGSRCSRTAGSTARWSSPGSSGTPTASRSSTTGTAWVSAPRPRAGSPWSPSSCRTVSSRRGT